MKNRLLNVLTASCAALLVCASVLAQQPAPSPAPEPRADVKFAGGTVQQYVDAVAKAYGAANAAVQPGVEKVPVGPVDLKNVTRRDAMMLIEGLSGTQARVQDRGETFVLFTVDLRKNVREVRVWPLAKVLAQMKPDDALSAVKAALDLAGEGASIKFHEDTTLLIINGTEGEIDAVSQVVDRLGNVAEWRRDEHWRAEAGQIPAGLEEQVLALRKEINELAAQVKAMQGTAQPTPPPAR